VLDVAAAAVKMAHSLTARDREEQEIEPARAEEVSARDGRRPNHRSRGQAMPEHVTRLFIGAGRRAGVRPADLVGAITGEAGVPSRAIGPIEISESFSIVGVPDELAEASIAAMKKASVRGQKVTVRLDRPAKRR
jgi:ATP-dependent RNA helicase DeaD